MYVCLCKGLTESDVHRIAQAGMVTAETLVDSFGLDDEGCCGRCAKNIEELVSIAAGSSVCGATVRRPACQDHCPIAPRSA